MFEQQIQKYLSEYISFPTVSSHSVIDFSNRLAEQAEDLGFQVHVFDSSPTKQNIIAEIGPTRTIKDDPKLCQGITFCGHMDVVPVDGQVWDTNPFQAHIKNEAIFGRGSCDMKGFFATTMLALQNFDLSALRQKITLIWTHDEEVGCLGAQSLVKQLQDYNISLPQKTLIGEPTNMNICRMHGGHTTIDIRIQGIPAHSSKPQLGCSAILILAEIMQSLQKYQILLEENPCIHPEMCGAHSLINIAEIQGGSAINIIPEHAHVRIGIRPMPGHSEDEIIADFHERIEIIQKKYPAAKIIMTIPQSAPAMITSAQSPLQKELLRIMPQSKSIGVPFATDGGRLQDLNLESIICGPGSINMAHKANEYVSFDQLRKSYDVQRQLIQACL